MLPALVEMDAATYEVNMTRYNAQDITKKHFLRQLTVVPPHKQTNFIAQYVHRKSISYSFLAETCY